MLNGYCGKMLFVDLTAGSIEEKPLTEKLAQDFLGGYGIGAKILYDLMPAGADPLGPDNILGFVTGPLCGTPAMFSGRYMIVHKSPVTGGWNDANSGGFFAPELKKAGYDAVFVSGISNKPVYLWIHDNKAELRDAEHLWGLDCKEVWEALKADTGQQKVRVVAVGPAGERAALLACPINDGHRAPGRGGGGAVMGSKNLKAIAVYGTGSVPVADRSKLLEVNSSVIATMKERNSLAGMGTLGTGAGTVANILIGDSPVKNWAGVGIDDLGEERSQNLSAASMDKHKVRKYACANCPLGCGAEYVVETGRWPVGETERPEYETATSFGSTLMCTDEDVIIKCNELCNRYGVDTISTGMTVGWAMECYENGLLSLEELDGIDLTWGNAEAIVAITQKICDGDGCGAILQHGSLYASKYYGRGEEYLVTASGIELPMHDPRLGPGLARTYQYDPTPGRHVKGGIGFGQLRQPPEAKYDWSVDRGQQDANSTANREILNSAGLCSFSGGCFPNADGVLTQNTYIEAVTGFPFDNETALRTGFRILTMRHAFNLREGIRPPDMKISPRAVGIPPLESGPTAGVTIDHEQLGTHFFNALDWDYETGKPSIEELRKIGGLEDVIKDLYGEE